MNKIKIVFLSALFAGMVSACSDEDKVGEIQVPGSDYVLPQGGDAKADVRILDLYNQYGTFFLYNFEEKDFNWTLIQQGMDAEKYQYKPIESSQISDLLDLLQIAWFDFYDASFLKKALPLRVFLTQTVQKQDRVFDWSTWEYVTSWVDIYACQQKNMMGVSSLGQPANDLLYRTKRAYKNYLQCVFLKYCFESGSIIIPQEFYTVSNYDADLYYEPSNKARQEGFVFNPFTDEEWSTSSWSALSPTDDALSYLYSLVYYTTEEWEENLTYELVNKKYNLLVGSLELQSVPVRRIGNTTYYSDN